MNALLPLVMVHCHMLEQRVFHRSLASLFKQVRVRMVQSSGSIWKMHVAQGIGAGYCVDLIIGP